MHENGKLVQGEAIADLGGATIAYKAFQNTPEYRDDRKIDGFSPEPAFLPRLRAGLATPRNRCFCAPDGGNQRARRPAAAGEWNRFEHAGLRASVHVPEAIGDGPPQSL